MSIPPFGSAPTPDSSSTKKGKIKLTNDMGGTADLPRVVNLHLSGDTDINHKLTSVTDPSSPQDVATKNYVDNRVSGLEHKDSCDEATVAPLATNIYNNGASGVGATLTGVSVGALSVDGTAVVVGQRLLVKDEVATSHNGIYVVTTVGTALVAYVLTRSSDFDGSGDVIDAGDTTYVTGGVTLAGTTWTVTSSIVTTVGTDPITWAQTAGPGALVGGDAITITANLIDFVPDNSTIEISADKARVKSLGITGTQLENIVSGATVGDATHVPVITYDNKGRVTGTSSATITTGASETFAFFNGVL